MENKTLLKRIKQINRFYKKLENVPYSFWTYDLLTSDPPTYGENKSIPSFKKIKTEGINCSGLINLICRKLKITIPDNSEYPGGTDEWYNYFKEKKVLNKFNINDKLESGTLLISPYRDVKNQGHVAIFMDGKIIQSYSRKMYNKKQKLYAPGVNSKQNIIQANKYFNFESYVKPADWLL